jgi:broad specificity phosphatase PhoE
VSATRLVLLRHGQHDVSVEDGSLTDVGTRQGVLLAAQVRPVATDIVVSSPLRRARETAEFLGQPYEILDGLREFDFGPAAPDAEALVDAREDLTLWRAADGFAGGETLAGFQARVAHVLELLLDRYGDQRVLAFTHSGVLDAALRWAYGLGVDEDWLTEAAVRNASITELEVWRDGRHPRGAPRHTVIQRVGDVGHLPSALVTEM